jgi:dipeptidyl aminopeptidase/acylaminoacyl peptidase
MLLIHGTTDDNVHVQNSLQFAYELQRRGKPFEFMAYPRSRHSFDDPLLTKASAAIDPGLRAAKRGARTGGVR